MASAELVEPPRTSRPDVPLLAVEALAKAYGGIPALLPLSATLAAGEVLALVGENGAGKSTLLKMLSGATTPDSGEIRVDGMPVSLRSPSHAVDAGIVTVYQEFSLFPTLTVAENLLFGQFPKRSGAISWPAMYRQTRRILEDFGLSLDPRRRVNQLSVAEKQMLEIARALHRQARVLILDEPTAVLGGEDVETLLDIVRNVKERGIGVIFVSHRLGEILSVSDTYLVLKDGATVSQGNIADTDHNDLVSKMVGREFGHPAVRKPGAPVPGPRVLLRLDHVSTDRLSDVSLTVREGEIVGLAGLRGAGRTEVLRAVFGSDPISGGSVHLDETRVEFRSSRDAVRAGIGLVPEERATQGAFLDMSIVDNIPLVRMASTGQVLVSRRAETAVAAGYRERMRLRTGALTQRVRSLSGGNQQKVVIAKWLEARVNLLLLDEPTRGVDIGAKFEIYELIEQLRQDGKGILLTSSELPELLLLCDRVVVLHDGSVAGELGRAELTEESIMKLAVGGDSVHITSPPLHPEEDHDYRID